MPLYEGIGLIGEKQLPPVCLDIGSAYTKCGFCGETGPRAIIPTRVKLDGQERSVFDYRSREDLDRLLVALLETIYFRRLLVSPKDRPVVVAESLLTPTIFRDVLASVSCLLLAPSHLLALMPLGLQTGLVLDIGHEEAVCIPVYEGVPVLRAWQALPLAARAVHRSLRTALKEHGSVVDPAGRSVEQVVDSLSDAVVEDIKVRGVLVAPSAPSEAAGSEPIPVPLPYPLPGGVTLTVAGRSRLLPAEVLFTADADNQTLATMLLDALLQCPLDSRRPLAASLVVLGGTAHLPGIKARLLSEVRRQAALPPYSETLHLDTFRMHRPPAKANYLTWLGGAMFGGTDVVLTRSLTREKYLELGALPDWCSLATPVADSRGV
ncbi:Actin-related protein 10 [Amphibalanus amphitrite]|uniref:Actin-related protein 10 n=1 Tax=Amphibalanus amphitrite TaxID=1232801 RepID=A0A6A4W8N1_AMPAM|nr:Actin-related protein 10 [Amphibalanus amphitrite]